MGPKLYNRITIFFGPHLAIFLDAPSSLVLLFSDLQQPPTCCSHVPDASSELPPYGSSVVTCCDLSSRSIDSTSCFAGPPSLERLCSASPLACKIHSHICHIHNTLYNCISICLCIYFSILDVLCSAILWSQVVLSDDMWSWQT